MAAKILFLFLSLVGVSGTAAAKPLHFEARDPLQRDILTFTSDGNYEKVLGLSHYLHGAMDIDPADIRSGIKGQIEADLRAFDTGDAIWNDFLRDKIMNAAEFPTATFVITQFVSASKARLIDKEPVTVKLNGNLTMRGITKPQTVLVKMTYFKENDKTPVRAVGNLLRITGNFDLDLASFDVKIPDPLKPKFAKVVQMSLDITGSDGSAPSLVPASEPAKKQD